MLAVLDNMGLILNEDLIDEIQEEFDALCQRISPSRNPYQFQTERRDDGSEHVEISDNRYHLVGTDRGTETCRKSTNSKDELLYWLVSDFTWTRALEYERENRASDRDFRRLVFMKQVEELQDVRPEWSERRLEEIADILKEHPFDDRGSFIKK